MKLLAKDSAPSPKHFHQRVLILPIPFPRKKKQWRAQHKKQFPCHNDGMLDIPSAGRLREVPALDYSFVWSDNRRSTRFSGVHECNEVSVKEEMRKPTLTFKQRANDSNFEGGDQRFDSEDMEEARGKKRPVTASFHHNANTMDSLSQQSFGDRKTLSNDETGSHVAADHLGTETFFQEKQNRSVRSCHGVVNGDKTLLLGKFGTMDFLPNDDEGCGNKRSLPSDVSDRLVASSETEMPLLQKQTPNVQSCSEVVRDDKVLVPKISELEFPKFDADCGNKGTSLGSDYRDGSSEHKYSKTRDADCDTSSVLEYSTVDTSTGDRGSEHENSFGEKGEVLYSVTGSKDHRNTTNSLSSDGSRSCAATDQECSKVVLLLEEQYQNFQSRLELAHENSNSVDSFAVSAEGCRSKSGMSTYTATGHQVSDLLGMNSESRTSFINDSSNGSAETFSTSAQGGEHVGPNTNGLEVYAEPPILQHDPGEAMELR
uniref:Uncharacterized protein n=1 Tax=Arundo donax TaxID=35708 RepID=A0A0A9D0L3_ARUDO